MTHKLTEEELAQIKIDMSPTLPRECTTCNSPHHRATECAATSDRSLLYVPMAEVDALRERVAEAEQRERATEASAARMRGYIAAATGKAPGEQSGLEAEVLSLCAITSEDAVDLYKQVAELELALSQAEDATRDLREQRARQRRELRRVNRAIRVYKQAADIGELVRANVELRARVEPAPAGCSNCAECACESAAKGTP